MSFEAIQWRHTVLSIMLKPHDWCTKRVFCQIDKILFYASTSYCQKSLVKKHIIHFFSQIVDIIAVMTV